MLTSRVCTQPRGVRCHSYVCIIYIIMNIYIIMYTLRDTWPRGHDLINMEYLGKRRCSYREWSCTHISVCCSITSHKEREHELSDCGWCGQVDFQVHFGITSLDTSNIFTVACTFLYDLCLHHHCQVPGRSDQAIVATMSMSFPCNCILIVLACALHVHAQPGLLYRL